MSSSIFNSVKDGVLFAIVADHQVIIMCPNFAKTRRDTRESPSV